MPHLLKTDAVFATSTVVTFLFNADFSSTCFRISLKPDIPAAANVFIGPADMPLTRDVFMTKRMRHIPYIGF